MNRLGAALPHVVLPAEGYCPPIIPSLTEPPDVMRLDETATAGGAREFM